MSSTSSTLTGGLVTFDVVWLFLQTKENLNSVWEMPVHAIFKGLTENGSQVFSATILLQCYFSASCFCKNNFTMHSFARFTGWIGFCTLQKFNAGLLVFKCILRRSRSMTNEASHLAWFIVISLVFWNIKFIVMDIESVTQKKIVSKPSNFNFLKTFQKKNT